MIEEGPFNTRGVLFAAWTVALIFVTLKLSWGFWPKLQIGLMAFTMGLFYLVGTADVEAAS